MSLARTTLVIEPIPDGHHFQFVAAVVAVAARSGPVVMLTSTGSTQHPAFSTHLGDVVADGTLVVHEVLDASVPPTADIARVAGEWARTGTAEPVGTIVLMDADQALKRWWFLGPRHLRGRPRPRVIFMLTRYPTRLALTDLTSWRLRGPKALLVLVARATGTLHRAVGFAGRDDLSEGWLVKRARDPQFNTAHARDRARWRAELGLPPDRRLVGVFGLISARKNAPLILEAIRAAGLDADLVLAGTLEDDVRAWVAGLGEADRSRVIVRDAFLGNDELDHFVAAVDVVPLALTNNGPSGIMGKAHVAGVPVVTTGSLVRAREVRASGAGLSCEFTAESIGEAMRQVLEGPFRMPTRDDAPVSPDEFASILLGVDHHVRSDLKEPTS
ncbi:MAG: hypothetical protein ABW004_11435 [Aeromicrobium sp.]